MLRAAKIDLDIAERALGELGTVYVRDAQAGHLSDEAIGAVSAVIRFVRGALDKTAHNVARKCLRPGLSPYYPIVPDPQDFASALEKQLPKLATKHPAVADAFERNQPFSTPEHEVLLHLPKLYRAHQHHDFALQENTDTRATDFEMPGGAFFGLYSGPSSAGWNGVLVSEEPETLVEGLVSLVRRHWIDWYWKNAQVSVWKTLCELQDVCRHACSDISATAGL